MYYVIYFAGPLRMFFLFLFCCWLPRQQHADCTMTMWAKSTSPIIVRRFKRAAIFTAPFVAVGAWAAYVLKERQKTPAEVRFSIGSAGDTR